MEDKDDLNDSLVGSASENSVNETELISPNPEGSKQKRFKDLYRDPLKVVKILSEEGDNLMAGDRRSTLVDKARASFSRNRLPFQAKNEALTPAIVMKKGSLLSRDKKKIQRSLGRSNDSFGPESCK